MSKDNRQKATSLYLSLMIITILLAIAFGLSSILLGQTGIIKEIGNSVLAFYAADAGIEEVLLNRNSPSDIPETLLPNGATYQVVVTVSGAGDCPAGKNYCIKSIGSYLETRRAIRIIY